MPPQSCPTCLWSGDIDRLFSHNSKAIHATRVSRDGRFDCLCCCLLMGLFDALGALNDSKARVTRDGNGILFQRDESSKSHLMDIYTLDTESLGTAARPIPFLKHLPHRAGSTSSSDSLNWVKRQLERCATTHTRCVILQQSFLPSRLIKVTAHATSRDVALVSRADISGHPPYLALSHCWGTTTVRAPCLTTASNYVQQHERIQWTDLTHSFQDAVDFTRRLGIDYLWIDGICIIQQDKEDWYKESTQMCSVYQNSYATLVAVHAQDGSGGLYTNTEWSTHPFRNAFVFAGTSHQLYTKPTLPGFHSWYPGVMPEHAPLFDRAWCYQERIVSARSIFFTLDEILFECFSETTCECAEVSTITAQDVDNPRLHHIAAFLEEEHDSLRSDILARTTQTGLAGFRQSGESGYPKEFSLAAARQEYRMRQWHNVVEYCSELLITNVLDRLPAVGALAEQYDSIRQSDTYLAGLWRSSLIHDLAWFPTLVDTRRISDVYVAPSWSWISVQSSVQFTTLAVPSVEVVGAECGYLENKTFGMAVSGKVRLKGLLVPLVLRADQSRKKKKKDRGKSNKMDSASGSEPCLWQEECKVQITTFYIDDGTDSISLGSEVFALELGPERDRQGSFSLLLRKSSSDEDDELVYTRVGCAFWIEQDKVNLSESCRGSATVSVCNII